jgi:hypothetical protein
MRVGFLTLIRRGIAILRISLCFDGMVEVIDLVLQCLDRSAHYTELAVLTGQKRPRSARGKTYSESLKPLLQQFGAYRHSSWRFPHRWHGT